MLPSRRNRLGRGASLIGWALIEPMSRVPSQCSMRSGASGQPDPGCLCILGGGLWRFRADTNPGSARVAPRCISIGADKCGSELHARVASHLHHIPTAGLRFFNVYGPRQDPRSPYSGVISIFCQRIATGAPIAIHGDGQRTRDFVYVTDVVAGLLAAMALKPADRPVINVCTGVPTSIVALARLIAEICGKPLQVRSQPPRAGEIRHSLGRHELADATLGLPAPILLRDGLTKVLAWLAKSQ